MTSIVNQVTTQLAAANPYDATTALISAILVLLLLALLVWKELLRATAHPRFQLWSQVLNIAIVPLLFAFCYLIIVRFVALLPI